MLHTLITSGSATLNDVRMGNIVICGWRHTHTHEYVNTEASVIESEYVHWISYHTHTSQNLRISVATPSHYLGRYTGWTMEGGR